MNAIWSVNLNESNGQNSVTNLVLKNFKLSKKYFYQPGFSFSSIFGYFNVVSNLLKDTFFGNKKINIFYGVISRSWLGIVRDLPFYFFTNSNSYIIHIHGAEINFFWKRNFLKILFYLLSLKGKCLIIVPSKSIAKILKEDSSRFITLSIENPYIYGEDQISIEIPTKDNLCIFWNSNLLKEKGYLDFLYSLTDMSDKYLKKINVVVAGKIIGNKKFCDQVNKIHKKLQFKNFKYVGSVTRSEMYYYLQKSTHILLPSYYKTECQPLSLIEGMCNGKQLVISDLPALLETVGEYPHVLVKKRDSGSIKNILEKICHESEKDIVSKNISEKDISYARERFNPKTFIRNLKAIFAEPD